MQIVDDIIVLFEFRNAKLGHIGDSLRPRRSHHVVMNTSRLTRRRQRESQVCPSEYLEANIDRGQTLCIRAILSRSTECKRAFEQEYDFFYTRSVLPDHNNELFRRSRYIRSRRVGARLAADIDQLPRCVQVTDEMESSAE